MSESSLLRVGDHATLPSLPFLDRLSRRMVSAALNKITEGRLTIADVGGVLRVGGKGDRQDLDVQARVNDSRVWTDLALRGSVGFGESYVLGAVSCNNLVDLVRLFLRNRAALQSLDGRLARLSQPAMRLLHALRENTPQGSRDNIEAHYDLGNEFYALWLDPTLSYSAAVFERPDMSLQQASRAKNDRVCRKLRLSPGEHLLEIGSGWGSLALHAATEYGVHVTTTTLSRRQFEHVRERVSSAGLADRITVKLSDYRELAGSFDKIVSIEMIEAVGYRYFDSYFSKLSGLLVPEGLALVQSITIEDQAYEAAKDDVDFIKRYIFPGSCIPSVTALTASATRSSDLRLVHLEEITEHYALTLRRWRERFLAQREAVKALGHSEAFCRTWEVYLAYCEGAFRERYLGDVQLVWARPQARILPEVHPVASVEALEHRMRPGLAAAGEMIQDKSRAVGRHERGAP